MTPPETNSDYQVASLTERLARVSLKQIILSAPLICFPAITLLAVTALILTSHSPTLPVATFIVASLVVLRSLLTAYVRQIACRTSALTGAMLRTRLISQLVATPLGFLRQINRSILMSLLGQDIEMVEMFVAFGVDAIVIQVVFLIFAVVFALWCYPILGLIICSGLVVTTLIYYCLKRSISTVSSASALQISQLLNAATEHLEMLPVLQAFGQCDLEASAFASANAAVARQARRAVKIITAGGNSVLVMAELIFLTAIMSEYLLYPEERWGFKPVFFFLSLLTAYQATQELVGASVQGRFAARAMERVKTITSLPRFQHCDSVEIATSAILSFSDVTFQYRAGRAIGPLNLSAPEGSLIAIIGPNGSGKSTVFDLAMRVWDPDRGSIHLREKDIRSLSLQEIHETLSLVTQAPLLVRDTIEANLRLAAPDATHHDLVAAAKSAEIHETIISLPDGYETILIENGANLSGGQRQRLALARTFLQKSAIILMDEATSALDPLTACAVRNAMIQLRRDGRTILAITHNMTLAAEADWVAVLENGVFTAFDTPDRLADYSELYRRYCSAYRQSANWALGEQ